MVKANFKLFSVEGFGGFLGGFAVSWGLGLRVCRVLGLCVLGWRVWVFCSFWRVLYILLVYLRAPFTFNKLLFLKKEKRLVGLRLG